MRYFLRVLEPQHNVANLSLWTLYYCRFNLKVTLCYDVLNMWECVFVGTCCDNFTSQTQHHGTVEALQGNTVLLKLFSLDPAFYFVRLWVFIKIKKISSQDGFPQAIDQFIQDCCNSRHPRIAVAYFVRIVFSGAS